MNTIKNQVFPLERALYNLKDTSIIDCKFMGKEDGESALKEASNIEVINAYFDLRYPLWHVTNGKLKNIEMTPNCRASLWYDKDITICDSIMNGIKAVRECKNINIYNTTIESPEFGWKSNSIKIASSKLKGEYVFLDSSNISLENVEFSGKYSFQYVSELVIRNCKLDTKDAFWHAKNVYVYDSYIKGEYLAWYSENVHLINCTIEGTQPLCYCKGLVLENCKMVDCDLSFEYSDVKASILGSVTSIKNPTSGSIEVEKKSEVILNDSKYLLNCKISFKEN